MKFTITMPDEQHDSLVAAAAKQNKSVTKLITDSIPIITQLNPKENQLLLSGKNVSDIGMALGGKTIRSADELVKLFKDNFTLSVDGISFEIAPEDAHALNQQYKGMNYDTSMSYAEYLSSVLTDSLSLYLYGSTSGKFSFR